MKYLFSTLLSLVVVSLFAQEKRENLSLEDIHLYGKTYPAGVYGIRHMQDGNHYSVMESGKVYKCSYTTEEREVLFDEAEAKAAGMSHKMDNYQISKSGKLLLIQTNTTPIYRHSKKSTYYLWNFENKTLRKIFNGEQVFYATLSPNEQEVAFVFDNNLYIETIANAELKQVTHDGEKNKIINGMTDWVYEEEFALVSAFEWSPAGDYLSFIRFDESAVKQYQIPVYTSGSYPEMYTYKYPTAGEDNSKISVFVYDVAKDKQTEVDLGKETDIYIPRMGWMNEEEMWLQRLNRHQNHLELLAVKAGKSKAEVFYEESSETYIDITDDLTFINDGKEFIMSSEKDGYNHLYCYNLKGKLQHQITEGAYDVTQFLGYDAENEVVYYQSAERSPLERHIYSVHLNGKHQKLICQDAGTHEASFSRNFQYFVHTYSNANTAPVISVKDNNGKMVRMLEDNAAFMKRWEGYKPGAVEFFTVSGADGTQLNAWQIKPTDFDESKQYPLLMFVYGGPGSQMVTNSWYISNKAWFVYLAQQGYYVVCVDNRGTGARGVEFKKCTYKNLGQIEVEDQIAAAEELSKLPYIDEKRIGMFGWSYGGFMTSHCLARGEIFKTGVAVAPVTSWEYYDNIYTERYMQRPIDNPLGYENTRVMKFADGLRDKNFLLVHGSFDDNVHPQNAFELMNALVSKNIAFDSEIYVNKNHGIYGGYTRIHLFKKLTDFLNENLMGQ
ncbi:alpha/beta fold hydrolase [bacterium]|nr:alpha/beta fold hydrolase [bacterium]